MSERALFVDPRAELDIESAYSWYEQESTGLGDAFLDELEDASGRITAHPLAYQDLGSDIRRALLRRFPYSIYFLIEDEAIVVLAVLHVNRDPAEWQRRAPQS